jgi:hypothetical protein
MRNKEEDLLRREMDDDIGVNAFRIWTTILRTNMEKGFLKEEWMRVSVPHPFGI